MRQNLFWLSDEQWARMEQHLPNDVRGVERADDRRVISGIIHVLKSGCRWCDCPPEYGPHTTIYNRFASRGGQSAAYGRICSASLRGAGDRPTHR
jgi:transposase